MTNDSELAVAIGRVEAKQDDLKERFSSHSENLTSFQLTAQQTFTSQESKLAKHETRLDGHDREIGAIKTDLKGQFTKNTVIIGLILTAVNIVFGLLQKLG